MGEYKKEHGARKWNGNVPYKYSVTLDDGTKANVGFWVNRIKQIRKERIKRGIEKESFEEQQLNVMGLLWGVHIGLDMYINLILEYKKKQETKYPEKEWDGRVPHNYSIKLENGILVNVGSWISTQKQKRKKRIKKGIKRESPVEKRLNKIGIQWKVVMARKIELEEHIAAIREYKEKIEKENPGKKWDGNLPTSYSVTLKDGTKANVGNWVKYQKAMRRKRLEKRIEEESPAEKQLNKIGILWEKIRQIKLEEYIDAIFRYELEYERKNPGKKWDGHVPQNYSITLDDGTKVNAGRWVDKQKQKRTKRLEKGIEEESSAEKRLNEIGILWDASQRRRFKKKS